ncbi:MAG TPA: glycerophosphodiester phosphodiesterase [Candidatus Paceibacterota bacterium]|nr:glycerophosphodiester phosphodiesterase [Verrucomicrobiota bacterium]HSA11302.1 glycerophosphodiester phosphodiesterase [Candidatus Paceibacterota bacterium]
MMNIFLVAILSALVLPLTAQTAKPVVIAHRGASGYLPEHTLEAKVLAHAMGADFIEQDVVLTKDDVPIVMHDIQLDNISDVAQRFPERKRQNGRYYALDFTIAELKQLRANERLNPKTGKAYYPNRFPMNRSSFQISTLEEELQLIQGLNMTCGRVAGIYPEIKQAAWHRKEGHDISRIVLPILRRYGYATKQDPCWIQCFEADEVKRIRTELAWEGHLLLLLQANRKNPDGSNREAWFTPAGMAELARFADGIGPELSAIVSGKSKADCQVSDFVKNAHAAKLTVHPYTLRADDLPKFADSMDDALEILFVQAKLDGLFTDFPDLTVQWLRRRGMH